MGKKNRKHTEKKKAVVEANATGGGKKPIVGIVVAVAVAAFAAFVIFSGDTKFQVVTAAEGAVRIPVAEVSDGQAHYYTYKGRGKNLNFFVLKSSDGVIRAAFDACDVCYRERKGYRQEGDDMVCNNCGQRFPSVKINVLKGGCNPAPLERSVEGGMLVLKTTHIEGGGMYF